MSRAMTVDEIVEAIVPQMDDMPLSVPPDPTPIADALLALRDAGMLTVTDCGMLGTMTGVRTLGDLRTVLDRGEVEEKLAKRLGKVLG